MHILQHEHEIHIIAFAGHAWIYYRLVLYFDSHCVSVVPGVGVVDGGGIVVGGGGVGRDTDIFDLSPIIASDSTSSSATATT